MLLRPARRLRPAVAALVAGVLLVCAQLMWGPGHGAMTMADHRSGMSAMNATADKAAAADQSHQEAAPAHGGCPETSRDCPLAAAHPPVPVALAEAPGPDALAVPAATPAHAIRAAEQPCAWPRAPDPVALLCVSRT